MYAYRWTDQFGKFQMQIPGACGHSVEPRHSLEHLRPADLPTALEGPWWDDEAEKGDLPRSPASEIKATHFSPWILIPGPASCLWREQILVRVTAGAKQNELCP